MTGLSMSAATHEVRKACQPPALGGSFLARRATSVCQSIDCMSTLKPAFSISDLATGARLVSTCEVGRMHQHDRRAVVAGLLQQRLRLVEVGLEQPVHALLGGQRRAADEQRLAGLVVVGIADHRLQEVLLVEGVPQRLAHLRVVERLVQRC